MFMSVELLLCSLKGTKSRSSLQSHYMHLVLLSLCNSQRDAELKPGCKTCTFIDKNWINMYVKHTTITQ